METRHLAIDWNLDHPAIHRDPFFGRFSFSAFDAVFIDPEPISRHWTAEVATGGDGIRRTDPERDRGFGRTLKAWMQRRRAEADDLLKRGGGIIVCRLRPRGEPLEILSSGGVPERVDRYSWLPSITLVDRHHQLSFPTNGRFLPRRGEDIVLAGTGSPFEDYLREFEGHIVYDAVYQDLLSTPIERFATGLARNRVGDIVALEIPFDEGRLILVPVVQGIPPAREASSLVEAARKEAFRPAFAPIPDWLPSYPLPGEDELVDELTGLTERRDALALKVEETAKKLEEKTRYKLLLYAKGRFSFLPAVADSFRALGFDVTESGPELVLQSPEGDAIVAAEATEETQVGLAPYRRLREAVDRAITDGEGPHKGILVVSGSRGLDPKHRPTEYAPGVLRGCEAQGICLLTSYRLFKLVQQALKGPRSKKSLADLRRLILECDGELRDAESR
ncbi:hypothetical protein DRJ24_01600 [Candidatus Acetothermia bacterium]|nr:MAG: hypothetical protein DRJ24_01600 [Candidatus Acetothermia bacterium]